MDTEVFVGDVGNQPRCTHPTKGRAWKMEPIDGGEVRRVILCACGQTRPARLGLTGNQHFDQLAARIVER